MVGTGRTSMTARSRKKRVEEELVNVQREEELLSKPSNKNKSGCRWRGVRRGREVSQDVRSKPTTTSNQASTAKGSQHLITGPLLLPSLSLSILLRPSICIDRCWIFCILSLPCLLRATFRTRYRAWCIIILILILSPALWYVLSKWNHQE